MMRLSSSRLLADIGTFDGAPVVDVGWMAPA